MLFLFHYNQFFLYLFVLYGRMYRLREKLFKALKVRINIAQGEALNAVDLRVGVPNL